MNPMTPGSTISGVGIGLRSRHYAEILERHPAVPWFEVLSDNYLIEGGPALWHLDRVLERYPVVLHGVGMSLGSTDPLNRDYLTRLKRLAEHTQASWVSDHLSWSSADGRFLHDLLPLPRTEEAVHHVARRIREVQDILGQRMVVENASSYLEWTT